MIMKQIKSLRRNLILIALLAAGLLGINCSEVVAPADTIPPETPRNFTLLGGGDGQAFLRWTANTELDLDSYRIYRSINSLTAFKLIASTRQTEYVDRFLDYDSTYYYYITAIDRSGNESPPSSIIDVQPLNVSAPQPPRNVVVSGYNNPSINSIEIRISWTPPDIGDLKNYYIYRGNDSDFVVNNSSFIDSTNVGIYVDKNVQVNSKYHYKIVAIDKGFKTSLPSKSNGDMVLVNPQIISPANLSRFTEPRVFKWTEVENAVSYKVFIGRGPLSDVIWSSSKTKDTEIIYTGPNLQSSQIYYCWITAFSKDKIILENQIEIEAEINSYSLINSFFSE
jgi:hypothetical protein